MTQHPFLKRIFLIRHGESEGNVNLAKHAEIPDPAIQLTDRGTQQSFSAGLKLAEFLQAEIRQDPSLSRTRYRLWYSPYQRTKQTKDAFLKGLRQHLPDCIENIYQHPLLAEQSFGDFDGLTREQRCQKDPEAYAKMQSYSAYHCWFFARPPNGESQFDVYRRVQPFNSLIQKQAQNPVRPIENVIVVAHGAVIRALAMDLLCADVDYFNKTENPKNASIRLIEANAAGEYTERMIFDGFDKERQATAQPIEYYPSFSRERE